MRDIKTIVPIKEAHQAATANLLNSTQAAELCGVSRTNMYNYFASGQIATKQLRHSRYATLEAVQAFAIRFNSSRVTWRKDCVISGTITSITPSKIFLLAEDGTFFKINISNYALLAGIPFDFLGEDMNVVVSPVLVHGVKMINFAMLEDN